MSLQRSEKVELADIKVSNHKAMIYTIPQLGTAIAVVVYDMENKIGGIAHIVLPESSMSSTYTEERPGKYANTAVPKLIEDFTALGGQKRSSTIRMVGGAQIFNFGGGGGNILNIGARNATAIRAAMSRLGFAIEKADTGGNKGKALRFVLASGQILVQPIGGVQYMI